MAAIGTLAILLSVGSGASWANEVNICIDKCFSAYTEEARQGRTTLRDMCLADCQKRGGEARVSYGAIAFGARSGGWGVAYGKRSLQAATTAAMARCRENGPDCEIAARYENACAAVAAVKPKGRYTVGQGARTDVAEARAMAACRSTLGGPCVLWVHSCATDTQ